jgi:L-alanine-DL-glutamate epimerase-like enolase superfamily enzyme
VSAFDAIAGLPLRVDDYALEGLSRQVTSDFTRLSTVIRLRGAGQEGVGEDVSYAPEAHTSSQAAGPVQPLQGDWTLASFCDHIESLELWPEPPGMDAFLHYRLWAYESAALDLALRQAGIPLSEALGREARPVTFVVSMNLGDPPSFEPMRVRLERYPTTRFKLDARSDWTPELAEQIQATGALDSIDLKGLYTGTVVDQGADPDLYRLVVDAFPQAWIEDPRIDAATEPILAPHRHRITWDANIHSVADIEGLPFAPRMVNVKPSRLGTLRELMRAYDFCAERNIGMYSGGQFEIGPGRGQIQYLSALFHPDTPNDVAPGGYNDVDPPDGLPTSPLAPEPARAGFRWGEWSER